MKKKLFLLFMTCMALNLLSCKDDDEKLPEVNIATDIAGTYKGELSIGINGTPIGSTKQRIYITEEGSSSVKLELKDFVYEEISVGNIVVPGIKITSATDKIDLRETNVELDHEALGKLQIKVTGSISNGKATINIKVSVTEGDMSIDVVFTGNIQNDNLVAAIVGTYVGKFKYEKLEAPADLVSYKQSFTITEIDDNLVKMDMSNIAGLNPTLDSLEITQDGNTVTLTPINASIVNGLKMNIEQIVISGFTAKSELLQKGVSLTIRTSIKKGDQFIDQYRITSMATFVEKANEAFITGITWTANPDDMIIGDPKIVNTREGVIIKANDPYYGMVKYSGDFTYYTVPGITPDQLKQLKANFQISEGATIKIQSITMEGVKEELDLSAMGIICTIVAKDSLSYTTYNITRANGTSLSKATTYKFDYSSNWNTIEKSNPKLNYYEPKDWATSNGGIYSIKSMLSSYYSPDKPYVVTKGPKEEAFGGTGLCAKLQTVMTNEAGTGPLVPKVTAGSLFLGTFETNMNDVLASTHFGIIYKGKKLTSVTGKYKYTPGTEFWNNMTKDQTGKQDKGSATAVLYEVSSYSETLNGHDIYNSPKIVANGQFTCEPQDTYADFTLTMEYAKEFDSSKKYKLAVIFSSSKEGDKYFGAVGSTLWIDNVTITME